MAREMYSQDGAPWANAHLRVVDKREIRKYLRPKACIHLQGPNLLKERIDLNLRYLNAYLLSQYWKVIAMGEHKENGMDVDILLGNKSIPLLRQQEFIVQMGITLYRLRILPSRGWQRNNWTLAVIAWLW